MNKTTTQLHPPCEYPRCGYPCDRLPDCNERPHAAAATLAQEHAVELERSNFESWLLENRFDAGRFADGVYHSVATRNFWLAWQARAVIAAGS